MINKIIDAISISIDAEFGDQYKIYTEEVKQGLDEPCFFILCINPTNELFRNNRYFRTNHFSIQYFPCTDEPKAERNAVAERLYDCLKVIPSKENGPSRGTRMSSEMVDGVLNFFVNYDMYVYKVEVPGEPMENLNVRTDAKG